uniref:RING-type E3 ubiquitin transferase n=1 Tax=Rhizophora mucronata TaxID=61149 RepID=A0A2P2MYJ9_RHIMU
MNASIFFYVIFFSTIFPISIVASQSNCSRIKCSDASPDIGFPFQVPGQQPQDCGLPGFKLLCKENATKIHFPSYGDLVVKSISYNIRKLDLLDPKNCVHGAFLNLNLSLTPFQYYYVVNNYTYINCSTVLPPSFTEIPCLSGSKHHVYTLESSLAVPVSCGVVKTVAIPFAYSPYIADNSFGLGLTWSLPGCQDCEAKGGLCRFQSKEGTKIECLGIGQHYKGFSTEGLVSGEIYSKLKVLLYFLAVIALAGFKIYQSNELDGVREKEPCLEYQRISG